MQASPGITQSHWYLRPASRHPKHSYPSSRASIPFKPIRPGIGSPRERASRRSAACSSSIPWQSTPGASPHSPGVSFTYEIDYPEDSHSSSFLGRLTPVPEPPVARTTYYVPPTLPYLLTHHVAQPTRILLPLTPRSLPLASIPAERTNPRPPLFTGRALESLHYSSDTATDSIGIDIDIGIGAAP